MDDASRLELGTLLAAARTRIDRTEAAEAHEAAASGDALIVDIRSEDERRRDGIVPGSLHLPRSVLEWRIDPSSGWHNPHVGGPERRLLLLCAEGYSSSLAAATLVDLGFSRAGDIVGGYAAWRREGLPVQPAPPPPTAGLKGMGPPDAAVPNPS